jgi:hypothetical protein
MSPVSRALLEFIDMYVKAPKKSTTRVAITKIVIFKSASDPSSVTHEVP